MGVDGCWCAPRSSKPVRGVKSLSGEFDSHMLPPEPRGRVPRGFLKNVDFPLDRTEGSSYNTTVRGVSRTTSYPGVAQLVARMVRDHEAVSSNLATRTMRSILRGTPFFLFSKLFCDSCTETCNFRYPLLLLVEGLVPYYIQKVSYD